MIASHRLVVVVKLGMEFPDSTILIFAKAPIKGQVKTRLIPEYGAGFATDLHTNMVQHCIKTVVSSKLCPVELWCAPDTKNDHFKMWQKQFDIILQQQVGRDLGERMSNAFKTVLLKSRNAIIIGTDCPMLSKNTLYKALNALHKNKDAVLTPAEDGGYALIGLKLMYESLFYNIPWGTENVLDNTREQLKKLNLEWLETEVHWDVDRPDDIRRLNKHNNLKYLLPPMDGYPLNSEPPQSFSF